MNYSFEYIDIILLAMIAGFIFLRLRGILGKKTGFEGKMPSQFEKEFKKFEIKNASQLLGGEQTTEDTAVNRRKSADKMHNKITQLMMA